MKFRIVAVAASLGVLPLLNAQPAAAIGCISGGLAGAIAGHAVHHGVMGAVGGCVAGHEYHKHQVANEHRSQQTQIEQAAPGGADHGGSSSGQTE